MGNISSVYEHPVLLQLSVMIDIKLSFLGLCHQVQTYLSYCQLETLLSPACVCPWDTITCGSQHRGSIGRPRCARSWQSALSNGCSLPEHTSGASIYSRTRQQWSLTLQYILFIIPVSCSSIFFSFLWVFTMDYQWESCRKCNSLRKKILKEEKKYSLAFFSPIVYYQTEWDWKYWSKVMRHLRNPVHWSGFNTPGGYHLTSVFIVIICSHVCVCVFSFDWLIILNLVWSLYPLQ